MTAINVKVVRESPNCVSRTVQAFIVSDTVPETLPTNGASVIGLAETDTFAPFSILYVVGEAENKLYIANENGEFVAQ